MKKLLSLIALGACLTFGAAQAQPAPAAAPATAAAPAPLATAPERVPTAQQNRMAACNKDATGKKGDDRKAFMKSCLSNDSAATGGKMTPQEKMKTCNAGATTKKLKGDDRKTYMKTCLSAA
jgi:hypothetical protein